MPREECELVPVTEAAELAESELDEQDGLMIGNDTLDDCAYNGEESIANGDDLLMNIYPSSGLWSDDSPLNPEEGLVTMTQSAADDSSLVSRLVGVLVVAMCVARGRQARAIPNS